MRMFDERTAHVQQDYSSEGARENPIVIDHRTAGFQGDYAPLRNSGKRAGHGNLSQQKEQGAGPVEKIRAPDKSAPLFGWRSYPGFTIIGWHSKDAIPGRLP